jgi:hypothetical protein
MAKAFRALRDPALGLDDILGFGMHIGYTVNEILKDRPEYIKWLMHNTELKFRQSVHEELYHWLAEKDTPKPKHNPYGYLLADYADQEDWFEDVPF